MLSFVMPNMCSAKFKALKFKKYVYGLAIIMSNLCTSDITVGSKLLACLFVSKYNANKTLVIV